MSSVAMITQRLDRKGLTLIELLIALAILTIAVLAAFGPLQQFARINGEMEVRATAVQLAQARLEEVKARGFAFCLSNAGTQTESGIAAGVQGTTFDRILIIDIDNNLAVVQVTVEWDYRGRHNVMSFATAVANMGG